ncbi:MAG: phosphotransferase family protein [Deltaproteobacteria bacterium]|nr:phosphotransferase family protein [Deltaproteobacteria bacterium]MBW2392651.1 phosphotransferase family protein [Deltaproteobacteria bacterium]
MAEQPQRDLELTATQLAQWLQKRLSDARNLEVIGLSKPAATGFSNDTLLFDLLWDEAGEARRKGYVVRIEPTGPGVFPEYDLSLQYDIMDILGKKTTIPVPAMLDIEDDASVLGAPFYVMEKVEGQIPPDNPPYHMEGWLKEAPEAEQQKVWWSCLDTMVDIHKLDWKALGMGFLKCSSPGETHLAKQLNSLESYYEWAARGVPNPTIEPALRWLVENKPREPVTPSILWGDSRIGNMIFRQGECAAVLDWEMAVLGDPAQDLAWWLFLDRHHSEGVETPRIPGLPSHEATVARYEEKMGRSVENLAYYEIFAATHFSTMMMRIAQQLVHSGLMPEANGLAFERNNIVTRLLAKSMGLPAPE